MMRKVYRKTTWHTACELGLALPGAEESTSYGTPALKVSGTLFARLWEDAETLVVRTTFEEREDMLAAEPRIYHLTDHYVSHPWVLVRLSRVNRDALKDLLARAHTLAIAERPKPKPKRKRRA